ncbi:MAG: ABC transporter substrate-binding protein [Microcella sp.]|nr:ABC transporter substrate-binding protein [Microcella sp.]
MTRLVAAAASLSVALVLAGCAEPRPLPTPTPTPTETVAQPTGDGVLRIGALVPMSGDINGISPGMVAAVELAVRDANVAGGALGANIEAFYRDAGTVDGDRLESGFAELVERKIDVVIAPSSPVLLARLLPLAAEAGVAVVATAAPGPMVRLAEPAGVLLRTIPAVDREAVAIAQALVDGGADTIALVAGSDLHGRAVVDAVQEALSGTSTTISAVERADSGTNIRRLSFSLASSEPDAVVIATTGLPTAQTAALVTALLDRGVRGEQLWLTAEGLGDYSSLLATGALEGATGVRVGASVDEQFAARLRQSDPLLRIDRFAPETYDGVVLAVLATVIAGDDGGPSIARAFTESLRGDVVCRSVGECLDVLDNRHTIDYDGLSGPLGIDEAGDVVSGALSVFRYDDQNRPQPTEAVSFGG